MKKLQNNFTTPEQSKRLLELGVPADSADCAYRLGIGEFIKTLILIPKDATYTAFADSIFRVLEDRCLPCWSAGRLIEIYNICVNLMPGMQLELDMEPENCTYTELIIASFELASDNGLIDLSELEE